MQIAAQAKAEGIGEEDERNKRKVLVFSYFCRHRETGFAITSTKWWSLILVWLPTRAVSPRYLVLLDLRRKFFGDSPHGPLTHRMAPTMTCTTLS